MTTRHSYADTDALREALFGRSVASVQIGDDDYSPEGRVLLDDGTELILQGNEGGCLFIDERDAARAYDAAVAEHHGPDALTNQSIGLLPEEEA